MKKSSVTTFANSGKFHVWLYVSTIAIIGITLQSSQAYAQDEPVFPEKVYAPYIDVLAWPQFSITEAYNKTGQKFFTLAFITSGGGCTPKWGGTIPMEQNHYVNEIEFLRSTGGDVIVSFGGANGSELAMTCPDVANLAQAYQSVIDRYNLEWIDLDIEGYAVGERSSVDIRNRTIKILQDDNPQLKVAYCLPTMPQGLTADGLFVIENAKSNGVRIDMVNVMAMDYGDYGAPNPEGQMGRYATEAAASARSQLLSRGIECSIGVTPMIGQNDVQSERFYQEDARHLLEWAMSGDRPQWVGLISMWSANRDNGKCPGSSAQSGCSGIAQQEFEFMRIFSSFCGGGQVNSPPTVSITAPADNAAFPAGTNITISADAKDADGNVVKVEFYSDSHPLGTVDQPPYRISASFTAGLHTLTAAATDNNSSRKTSTPVRIAVGSVCSATAWKADSVYVRDNIVSYEGRQYRAKWWTTNERPGTTGQWGVWLDLGACGGGSSTENKSPEVFITSPANGSFFNPGVPVVVTVSAKDPDGTIEKLEMFVDSICMYSGSTDAYTITLINLLPGVHTISAAAADNKGAVKATSPIQISVSSTITGCYAYPAWDPGQHWTTYNAGDRRTNGGKLWECKNPAYSYWEPSGPYGHFGWNFI
jgi:chitodextrinase